ncbi:SHOCT domain-containing protein [Thermodesulfobacteriota bacterium]
MMHWFSDYSMGMGFGMPLFMIFFWGMIILVIAYLVKFLFTQGNKENTHESAEEILKKRFARGEISQEQFQRIKKELTE